MRKRSLWSLACGLAAVLTLGLIIGAGRTPARSDEPAAEAKVKPGEGKRAKEFIAAFNRGDAKACAAFWTEEGTLVDDEGHESKGRAAIEKVYKEVFAQRKGAKLHITVTSARQITPAVAIEDGISEVTDDNGPPTTGRFTAVGVKKDGEWYFESVHEAPAPPPPSNAKHFGDLEWLIGDWTTGAKKGEGSNASYNWAENGNFIVSTFATTINASPSWAARSGSAMTRSIRRSARGPSTRAAASARPSGRRTARPGPSRPRPGARTASRSRR
jgi:uncharacterized protein (TIGR02246 family)